MRFNPTCVFLGLVSAALSVSLTCAVPLNASPEDSLATRAPVQDAVPVNRAGEMGSLAMRTSTRDTEPVETAISLVIRADYDLHVFFINGTPIKHGGSVCNTKEVEDEVHKVVKGYWAKMRLSGEVSTRLKNCPRNGVVNELEVSGSILLRPTYYSHSHVL
ncbi:hypothetical protein GG344DRAFT_63478 [Lentinula edodes]|nr:hypothetical protein GG344DRAFT_63478 [Lentinula edodes]